MKKIIFFALCLMVALTFPLPALANGVTISAFGPSSIDTANNRLTFTFDITWNNSWRNATNYDAVWIFMKRQNSSTGVWSHATMSASGTNPTAFTAATNSEIIVPTDRKGFFLQRTDSGSGTVTLTGVRFVWDYGADGFTDAQAQPATSTYKLFAIEMTYIPQGGFYAGDGNATNESPYALHPSGSDNTAAFVGTTTVSLTCDSNVNDDIDTTPIDVYGANGINGNSSWPTGYNGFYLMKYEITQGQYRDFLNTLSEDEQSNRVAANLTAESNRYILVDAGSVANRNGVVANFATGAEDDPYTIGCDLDGDSALDESVDGEWIGCNYLKWTDLAAFLDWAALRPMTELEFEKACRGTNAKVYQEYAWGNTTLESATSSLTNGGQTSEVPNQGNMNYTTSSPDGPYRAGSFADASSSRQNAGAGLYGNMDLGGNACERTVSIGHSTGRAFLGSHGDGTLLTTASYEGNATNSDWPGYTSGQGVSGATGVGERGGSFNLAATYGYVSDRTNATSSDADREIDFGGRGCRTAP